MRAFTGDIVNRASPSSGQIQAQAQRSLAFLQAIENTVTSTEADVQFLRAMTADIHALIERLSASESTGLLDPEGRAAELMSLAAAGALRMHERGVLRRQHARADARLTDDDGVVDCLTELIAALADYHNIVERARDTIESLDALQSPVLGQTYTDVDAMLAHLTR